MANDTNNKNIIYGVDITKKVTPVMVRDAIIMCFTEAHNDVLESLKDYSDFKSEEEFKKIKEMNILYIIQSAFKETGGDFNNPTKDTLKAAIGWLAGYAKNFRKPEVIEKHYSEIMTLISLLE